MRIDLLAERGGARGDERRPSAGGLMANTNPYPHLHVSMLSEIPDDLIAFFVGDPRGALFAVPEAAENPDSQVFASLSSYLTSIPDEMIRAVLEDPHFRFLASRHEEDLDREARIWITERLLSAEIPRRRNELVRTEVTSSRPKPYNVPAVSDLKVDHEHLVPLSVFEFDGSRLLRNGHAFTVLSTTGSPNSTYWLINAIYQAKIADRTSVRLDPFLCGPEQTFAAVFYRMWIYGRPINWDRIANLQEPEHGRWQPGPLSQRAQFTDFVWTPRDSEVHFIAEEVPESEDGLPAAARYVHANYVSSQKMISHFDGALRLYTEAELQDRHTVHVRNAGKTGVREKVFRIDASIPRETLSGIVQAFYVWNQDISDYFTGTMAGR